MELAAVQAYTLGSYIPFSFSKAYMVLNADSCLISSA